MPLVVHSRFRKKLRVPFVDTRGSERVPLFYTRGSEKKLSVRLVDTRGSEKKPRPFSASGDLTTDANII
jgi:hypothetical protein